MYSQNDNFAEDYNSYNTYDRGVYEGHSGDPRQDIELEKQYENNPNYDIPDEVRGFILHFHRCLTEAKLFDVGNCYETSYPRLTEKFFKLEPWPIPDSVSMLVDKDVVFMILYKELYYRHIYARIQGGPSQEQRFESYYNYCNLFNYILNAEGPVPLEIPDQWLWDIIDEFIYQFQEFSKYRSKLNNKTDSEIDVLRNNPKIWNVHSVLNVLHSLVEKSNINQQLEVYATQGDPDSVAGDFGRNPLYKMLGYFSLIGLLRLHSLLGDYYQAIKALENIELNKKSLYSRVPACQVTTYYYVGFAYLMMRRYQDAIRSFANILLYIQRTMRLLPPTSYQTEFIKKMNEQMYTLLATCLTLHPMRIDESIHTNMRDKTGDRLSRMQKGDIMAFEECFVFAAPRFLSPVPPNYDNTTTNYHKEPSMLQTKVFLEEVRQQLLIPEIRSFLKLYTTMPVSKLAAFLNLSEEEFRTQFLCFKHKMMNLVWTKGSSGLEGEFQAASEVDFYVDGDMVHIADTKVAARYGDFFIRQIHKLEEMNRALKKSEASLHQK